MNTIHGGNVPVSAGVLWCIELYSELAEYTQDTKLPLLFFKDKVGENVPVMSVAVQHNTLIDLLLLFFF